MGVVVYEKEEGRPFVLYGGYIDVIGQQGGEDLLSELNTDDILEEESSDIIKISGLSESTRSRVDCTFDLSEVLTNRGQHVSVVVREKKYDGVGSSIRLFACQLPDVSFMETIPFFGQRALLEDSGINSRLIFACDARTFRFVISQVTPKENFLLRIPPFVGDREIQFIDYIRRKFDIDERTPVRYEYEKPPQFARENLNLFADDFSARKKIYQLYNTVPQQVQFEPRELDVNNVEPDYELDITDLAIRGRLFTVFREIMTPLKFKRQRDSTYQANILYETADSKLFYTRDPVFIVNGKLTHDGNFISQLPIQDVKTVKIYNELDKVREAFGPMGSGGIVEVEMVDPQYGIPDEIQLPSVRIKGLQSSVEYPILVNGKDDMPLLNPLLYWNPDLNPTDGTYQFEFMTSDDVTTFEIEIISTNALGEVKLIRKDFEVRQRGT